MLRAFRCRIVKRTARLPVLLPRADVEVVRAQLSVDFSKLHRELGWCPIHAAFEVDWYEAIC